MAVAVALMGWRVVGEDFCKDDDCPGKMLA